MIGDSPEEFAMVRLLFSRRWWLTTLLVITAIGVVILLGFWQLGRYAENRAYNAHLNAMQVAPALVLSTENLSVDLTGMEYRTVQAAGAYDFTHQVAIRNQVWTQSWGDDVGYTLVTPLIMAGGQAVLVERGWIPLKDNQPASWRQYDQPGRVTVTGVIRLPAKPEMGGAQDPTPGPGQAGLNFWNIVNIPRLQKQIPYPLLPIYIQQAPDPAQTGLPYRDSPVPNPADDGTNLGYALVWFSFGLLLLFGYPSYLRKQEGHTVGKNA
jgi:surfeit locus 1 family protein